MTAAAPAEPIRFKLLATSNIPLANSPIAPEAFDPRNSLRESDNTVNELDKVGTAVRKSLSTESLTFSSD